MVKKHNLGRASLSAIYTHITYIREKIDSIDKKVDRHINNFENCRMMHDEKINDCDDRISKLENWKKFNEKQFQNRIQKYGLAIAIITTIVSAVLSMINIIVS